MENLSADLDLWDYFRYCWFCCILAVFWGSLLHTIVDEEEEPNKSRYVRIWIISTPIIICTLYIMSTPIIYLAKTIPLP